tara:strand:+ start:57431 stop:57604 length:174 start_codon:yes stop_codon:yes gene_type:complete
MMSPVCLESGYSLPLGSVFIQPICTIDAGRLASMFETSDFTSGTLNPVSLVYGVSSA